MKKYVKATDTLESVRDKGMFVLDNDNGGGYISYPNKCYIYDWRNDGLRDDAIDVLNDLMAILGKFEIEGLGDILVISDDIIRTDASNDEKEILKKGGVFDLPSYYCLEI